MAVVGCPISAPGWAGLGWPCCSCQYHIILHKQPLGSGEPATWPHSLALSSGGFKGDTAVGRGVVLSSNEKRGTHRAPLWRLFPEEKEEEEEEEEEEENKACYSRIGYVQATPHMGFLPWT
ncbi:uncharacterized protein SETTUDRAFT_36075 [Exserohilum turcica Et28A]|uniref:Uncharacterized protein n=1 Tax=Exserohilum turcicum (strain 28A) TaxID=671987 RepID=R0I6H9_EXST2|nr:uncharacterized protein SETTUDRAFT_36075 [Exserohilum turcica Et28A]EOA81200.1 hypothetical protein SETTUDRAFT_36075 [Exserohilum turcica Et28A]